MCYTSRGIYIYRELLYALLNMENIHKLTEYRIFSSSQLRGPPHPTLHCNTPHLTASPSHHTGQHRTPQHPTHRTPPHSAAPHLTPSHLTPLHSTPPHPAPPHRTPPHPAPPHPTTPHSTPLHLSLKMFLFTFGFTII